MTHRTTPTIGQAEAASISPPKLSNSSPTKPFDGIIKGFPSKLSNTAPINFHPESLTPYPSSKPSPTSVPVSPSKTAKLEQTAECNKRVGWVLNLFSEGKLEMAQTSAEMILANQKGLTLYHRAPLFAMLALFPGGVKYGEDAARIYKYLSVKHPEFKPAYQNAEETRKLAHKIAALREVKEMNMKKRGSATADDVSHEHFQILYYNFYKNMHKEGYERLIEDAFESESGSSLKPSVTSNDTSDSAKSVKNAKYTSIPEPRVIELSDYETTVDEYLETVEEKCTCKTMEECMSNTVEDLNTVEEEKPKTVEEEEFSTSEQDGYKTAEEYGEGRIWVPIKLKSSSRGRQKILNDESHALDAPRHESPSKGKQLTLYNTGRVRSPRRQECPSKGKQTMDKRAHCCSSESIKDIDQGSQSDTATHRSKTFPEKPKEQPKHKALYPELKGGRKRHTIRVGHGMGLES
ncbi:hypothetical protein FIE12Z_8187 [Fusarium flagelliforme]|uniref:Uncharacterized protein n=1 Tax=Fusarium flagelliforme TaxID=2675880 RepID=A0A395MI30_9HYPO|nr:hypothetical protein FIE12Z_8187 [Fusarium flagelliforme]